jgi:hypothetical protein
MEHRREELALGCRERERWSIGELGVFSGVEMGWLRRLLRRLSH